MVENMNDMKMLYINVNLTLPRVIDLPFQKAGAIMAVNVIDVDKIVDSGLCILVSTISIIQV